MSKDRPKDYLNLSGELEEIVTKLQDEKTSIEQSLKLYERGVSLVSELETYLKQTKNKLNKISSKTKAN